MRKVIALMLAALVLIGSFAVAESKTSTSFANGEGAVRTSSELYVLLEGDGEDVVVKLSPSGDAVCVDRADDIDSLIPYSGGAAYLKTENGVSSIMLCSGTRTGEMYKFDGMVCTGLSAYGDNLLVLSGGLLYSVNPNDQVCLKLSGAQMLEYCVGGDYAYYLSGTDMMQCSATVTDNGEKVTVTTDVGCIYRLDLTSGETMLMLKSGGTDIQLKESTLLFHSPQDMYGVRTDNGIQLRGKLYSLDVNKKKLNAVSSEEDSKFWAIDAGAVIRVGDTLSLINSSTTTLYTVSDNDQIVSDGTRMYVWAPEKNALTQIDASGSADIIYTGDMNNVADISSVTPIPTAVPVTEVPATPVPTPIADENNGEVTFGEEVPGDITENNATENNDSVFVDGGTDWFDSFMEESQNVQDQEADPTPIGQTPTPSPMEEGDGSVGIAVSATCVPDSSVSTYAVSGSSVVIVDSAANVRIGPGTNYDKIFSIPQGCSAELMGIASKSSVNGTEWYKVSYKGATGWVSSMYAKIGSAKSSSNSSGSSSNSSSSSSNYSTHSMDGKYVRISGGAVNMRSGPSKNYKVITSIPNGATVTFKGKYAKDSRGVKWYKVTYKGSTGWVSSKYATVTNSSSGGSSSSSGKKVKTTGDVTIRKSANKTSKKLGYISAGKTVTYLGSAKKDSRGVTWYKIKYNGVTGWVSSKYSKLV